MGRKLKRLPLLALCLLLLTGGKWGRVGSWDRAGNNWGRISNAGSFWFNSIPGLWSLHLADRGVTVDASDSVTVWADQALVTASTDMAFANNKQAIYIDDGTFPVIRLNGTTSSGVMSGFTVLAQPHTIFLVASEPPVGVANKLLLSGSASYRHQFSQNYATTDYRIFAGTSVRASGFSIGSGWHIWRTE